MIDIDYGTGNVFKDLDVEEPNQMTPDEVKQLIQGELGTTNRALTADFVQWLARSAFEAGWRAGGGDPVESPHTETARGWRSAWLSSEPRSILVRNGIISGSEGWR